MLVLSGCDMCKSDELLEGCLTLCWFIGWSTWLVGIFVDLQIDWCFFLRLFIHNCMHHCNYELILAGPFICPCVPSFRPLPSPPLPFLSFFPFFPGSFIPSFVLSLLISKIFVRLKAYLAHLVGWSAGWLLVAWLLGIWVGSVIP